MIDLFVGLLVVAVIGAIAYLVGGTSWRYLSTLPAHPRTIKKMDKAETVTMLGVMAILISASFAIGLSLVAIVGFAAGSL